MPWKIFMNNVLVNKKNRKETENKMTNFEKYKNEVLRILEVSSCETPSVKNGIPMICDNVKCIECDLRGDDINCIHEFIKWLYEDDSEEPDGCDDYKYEYKREDESPCTECCNNYTSKWKHKPKKTRQDEFLEHYPDAQIDNSTGVIVVCPRGISREVPYNSGQWCAISCTECCQSYWLQEVEE